MYKVAICDDEITTRYDINNQLKEMFPTNILQISQYQDGSDLTLDIENGKYFDIILLDISMDNMDGIEAAQRIRAKGVCKESIIIFITSYVADVSLIVDLNPFAYIYKNNLKNTLEKRMKKAMEVLENSQLIEIVCDRQEIKIRDRDITYIEVIRNTLYIHTETEIYETRSYKMHEICEIVSPYIFVRCHQSYLVNYHFIKKITQKYIEMRDGTVIYISKKYKQNVLTFEALS